MTITREIPMRTILRRGRAVALTAALTAASVSVATPAHATTASFNGGVLTIAFSQPDYIRVEEAYDIPGTYRLISWTDNLPSSLPGCARVGTYFECPGVTRVVMTGSSGDDTLKVTGPVAAELRGGSGADELVAEGVTAATLYGETGNDELYVGDMAPGASTGATIDGGDGDDAVAGSPQADHIQGGAGNDRLAGYGGHDTIAGGAGHDVLMGDSLTGQTNPDDGNDVLYGDEGDDVFHGQGGADTFHGGPGVDTADYYKQYEGQAGVVFSASLDGVANDGAAGEGDNVNADGSVENISSGDLNFTLDAVTLIGDDGPNHLKGYSPRSMTADGRGGNDLMQVSAMLTGGRTTAAGGAGDDSMTVSGETTSIDGGAGNDTITGGRGDDSIVGGPGIDSISSWAGNDTIDTVDGEIDSIGCGIGADTLRADEADVVNADPLQLCEALTRVAGVPGPVSDAGGAGKLSVALPTKVRVSKKGTVRFKVSNGFANNVKLTVVAKVRKLTFGKGKGTIKAGRAGKLTLTLTKAGKAQLRRRGKVVAKVTVRAVAGAKGRQTRKVRFIKR